MKLVHYALGIVAIVGAATAADAAVITYTVTGNTAAGSPFSIAGTGDTSTVFGFGGDANVPVVLLTSNTIAMGPSTGSITGGSLYFFDNRNVSISGFNLNLAGDFFDFTNSQFATYDAVTSLGPISVSQTFGTAFNTTFGSVNLTGATNLSFQAVTAGGAVPEPGTWAMMLVGFTGLGMAMRVRRRNANLSQLA
jgi:hypothetical protein